MTQDGETYLGDGLYASYDGWQFCLRAPRTTGDHFVYLEPVVYEAFIKYVQQNLQAPRRPGQVS
jgi:hypothetical protein